MDYDCNKCGSSSTQKISAIVSSGTSNGSSTSRGTTIGMVGGDLAVASTNGSTSATMKTQLAEKLAMPIKRTESWIFYGIFFGGGFGWISAMVVGFLGGVIINPGVGVFLGLIAGVAMFLHCMKHYRNSAKRNVQYNKLEYPQAIEKWNSGFYCHRCEHVFIPASGK